MEAVISESLFEKQKVHLIFWIEIEFLFSYLAIKMVKFRRWLLKNWLSASRNIFPCNKFIFFIYVYNKFSQVTVF